MAATLLGLLVSTATQLSTPPVAASGSVNVPILMYHYIRTNPVPFDRLGFQLSVSPAEFDAQMNYLYSHGVHTLTMAQVNAAVDQGSPLPPNPVVLTFDDGYADFATTATPILQRYGFVATDYVVPGFVGRSNYMTLDQLHQVSAAGMVLGAHTMHHVYLPSYSVATQWAEISQSRTAVQQMTGQPVDDFAYPYGGLSATTASLVVQAGFRDAVSTFAGASENRSNRFVLPRVRVAGGEGLGTFAARLGPLRPAVPVTGRVTLGRHGIPGFRLFTCTGREVVTDGGGAYTVYMAAGEPFCLRPLAAAPPTSLWLANNPEHATATTYEYQLAGAACYHACGDPSSASWDRNSDAGCDFRYADTVGGAAVDGGSGVIADSFGVVRGFGGNAVTTQAVWPGWSIVRGVALRTGGSSGYLLDGFGGLHPFGGAAAVNVSGYWPGWDIARGLVLNPCDSTDSSGWVLDGFGGLHPFSPPASGSPPPTLHAPAYWRGWDIARSVALNPCRQGGVSGYTLDGYGGLHPLWDSTVGPIPTPSGLPYWGWDIARSVAVTGTGHAYVLDGYGGLHAAAGAPPKTAASYWPGWDIARVVVASRTGQSVAVIDGFGGVHPGT